MDTTSSRRGAPRRPANTPRGEKILEFLDAQGLTLKAAAAQSGLSYDAVRRVVDIPDPGWLQVSTVVAVCERLGLPLELVAPSLGRLAKSTVS